MGPALNPVLGGAADPGGSSCRECVECRHFQRGTLFQDQSCSRICKDEVLLVDELGEEELSPWSMEVKGQRSLSTFQPTKNKMPTKAEYMQNRKFLQTPQKVPVCSGSFWRSI